MHLTFEDGLSELHPPFELFEPSNIRINVLGSRNAMNAKVGATITHFPHDPFNPILTIYLEPLEITDSTIRWKGFSNSFESIIYHELLHACGDSPILRNGIRDGVIRHTMIGTVSCKQPTN